MTTKRETRDAREMCAVGCRVCDGSGKCCQLAQCTGKCRACEGTGRSGAEEETLEEFGGRYDRGMRLAENGWRLGAKTEGLVCFVHDKHGVVTGGTWRQTAAKAERLSSLQKAEREGCIPSPSEVLEEEGVQVYVAGIAGEGLSPSLRGKRGSYSCGGVEVSASSTSLNTSTPPSSFAELRGEGKKQEVVPGSSSLPGGGSPDPESLHLCDAGCSACWTGVPERSPEGAERGPVHRQGVVSALTPEAVGTLAGRVAAGAGFSLWEAGAVAGGVAGGLRRAGAWLAGLRRGLVEGLLRRWGWRLLESGPLYWGAERADHVTKCKALGALQILVHARRSPVSLWELAEKLESRTALKKERDGLTVALSEAHDRANRAELSRESAENRAEALAVQLEEQAGRIEAAEEREAEARASLAKMKDERDDWRAVARGARK